MICSVDGCGKPIYTKKSGLCHCHYQSMWRYGRLNTIMRPRGTGTIARGYIVRVQNGDKRPEHVRIAETVLGKPLPEGAVVHHIDQNRANNTNNNLVICPSSAYHNLLHKRLRAFAACGNANWLKCRFCHLYDAPENITIYGRAQHHRDCNVRYQRENAK